MSSDTTGHSLGDPFPYRWLTLAVTVTVVMFALLTWHVYNTYRVGQLVSIEYVRSENLRDRIVELSGVIQVAARQALGKSDARAAASYREAVRELSRRLGQARDLVLLGPVSNPVSKAEAAHLRLRRLEAQAFARGGEGAGPAAAALLDSDEYRSDSEAFSAAVASFITQVRHELDSTLRRERNKELASVLMSFVIFCVSLAVWLGLVRRLHQWRRALVEETAERRRAEEQLHEAQKMESIGRLAAGVAHDFNNILTAISGFAELAAAESNPPSARFIDKIKEAARLGERVTRGLLTFSRKSTLEMQPVELGALVQEIVTMLRQTLSAAITVVIEPAPRGPLYVLGDRGELSQVLLNLALNARDAMPAGGTLKIGLAGPAGEGGQGGDDGFATIRVTDTGSGIAEDVRERIFEPFFTTRIREQGTGLGLSIVDGIVAGHGGHIEVESTVGAGATFVVRLPTTEGPVSEAIEEGSPAEPEAGRGGLLLLAEDHPYVRELMVSTLESCGYRVAATGEGGELLELFERHRGDAALAVIDFDLPVCDGGECLRRMRQAGSGMPVILITGRVGEGLEDRFGEEAIVLHKPFTMMDLSRVVSDALTGWGARHAAG